MPVRLCAVLVIATPLTLLACASDDHANAAPVADASVPSDAAVLDAGQTSEPSDLWGCLAAPSETTTPTPLVAITFKLSDDLEPVTTAGAEDGGSDFTALTFTPLPGITVGTCAALDPLCQNPLAPAEISDDAGEATVSVPGDFAGFFTFSGNARVPAQLYPGRLQADASTFAPPVGLLGTQEAPLVGQTLGVPFETDPDAGVGHVFVQVYDCMDRHAAGIAFAMSYDAGAETLAWYDKGELPSASATETDAIGLGGALNVPAGALTVTATRAATKQVVGIANVVVLPGVVTMAWIRPRTH